jgi:hypothetical protein
VWLVGSNLNQFFHRKRKIMLKWAKQRVRMLMLYQAGVEDAIASGSTSTPSTVIIAATAQRTSRHLVAISSRALESMSARELVRAPAYEPMRALTSPRRPGVHARWKEQNRVPFQNVM